MSLRLGIVGCGIIANAHGIASRRIGEGVRFAACADINEDAARKFAHTYGSNAIYTDYVEMIEKEKLDGVVVATWPALHRDQVVNAIKAGARFILCEKSLTMTGEEALDIYNVAGANGAMVVEGFMYTHHPAIARLDELIARPVSGAVDSIRASFHKYYVDPEGAEIPWRFRKETGGSVPYDRASYPINICARYARALPESVVAIATVSKSLGVVTRLYGEISYENGRVGVIECSNGSVAVQEAQITCADRMYRLSTPFTMPGDARIYEYDSSKFFHIGETVHTVKSSLPLQDAMVSFAAYQMQLEEFAKLISGKSRKPSPLLIESVVNSFTLDALVRAGVQKQVVKVEIPNEIRAAWLEAMNLF